MPSQLVREPEAPLTESAHLPKTKTKSQGPLADALRRAGSSPFTRESVKAYKRTKIKELHKRYPMLAPNRAVVRFLSARPELTSWLEVSILFGVVGAWSLLLIGSSFISYRDGFAGAVPFIKLFGLWALFFAAAFAYGLYIVGKPVPKWERSLVEFIPFDTIPERIHTAMDEIRFHCPNVEFDVDHITFMSVTDPFLIAKLSSADGTYEEYYVDVWDEQDFKKP